MGLQICCAFRLAVVWPLALVALSPSAAPAQRCMRIESPHNRSAIEISFVRLATAAHLGTPLSQANYHVAQTVLGDSAGLVTTVIGVSSALHDIHLIALAGQDSICYMGGQQVDGLWVLPDLVQRWNGALARVAPSLQVTSPAAARRLALAVLSFATAYPIDSLAETNGACIPVPDSIFVAVGTARRFRDGWNVHGVVQLGGSRLFFVRIERAGTIGSFFIQDPPDALDDP